MILLDTNLLARMTDSTHPHCAASRRAVNVLLARSERLIIVPQNLYEFWADAARERSKGLSRPMSKPTLYFDTSVISAYWYESGHIAMWARRLHTREWWDAERNHFSLWASGFGEIELKAGKYSRQEECVKMIRRLRYLTSTTAMKELSNELLERGLIPANKGMDAAHLAISTSHGIDYLLTWNYAHLANPTVQEQLNVLCDELGLVAPLLVSPESIPQERFGQTIRRK